MPRTARPGAHEALLDAAREEFARRGLDRARVEDIARRAGISKGAFYLHFRTKEEALREILQRFLGALGDHALRRTEVEDRIAREGPDGAGVLDAECALDADLLELLWRNRQIVAAVDRLGWAGNEAAVGEFRRRMHALVSGRLARRQAAGHLRPDLPPDTAADVVVGAYEGLARRMIDMKEKPDLAGWARALLTLLYEGLSPRPAAPRSRRADSGRPGVRRPSPHPE